MSSKRTPVYLGRTEVSVSKSSAEIQDLLVRAGARQIATDYNTDGSVAGMRFVLENNKFSESYALPIRTARLFERLQQERSPASREKGTVIDRQQAERIAWRQILLWLKAQLALMDVGMTSAGEVFFPYQIAEPKSQATIYQLFEKHGRKLIAAAGDTNAR